MSKIPDEVEILLGDWFRRLRENQHLHYASGVWYGQLHVVLGVPAAIFSVVAGAIVATLGSHATGSELIVIGALNVITAVLVGLQTFLKLAERAERHRLAASTYGTIRRYVEQIKTLPPSDEASWRTALDAVRRQMDKLAGEAPAVPSRIQRRLNPIETQRVGTAIFPQSPAT